MRSVCFLLLGLLLTAFLSGALIGLAASFLTWTATYNIAQGAEKALATDNYESYVSASLDGGRQFLAEVFVAGLIAAPLAAVISTLIIRDVHWAFAFAHPLSLVPLVEVGYWWIAAMVSFSASAALASYLVSRSRRRQDAAQAT